MTPSSGMAATLMVWWSFLITASLINIAAWVLMVGRLARDRPRLTAATYTLRRRLLGLAGVYVVGCAFRSWLPRADVQRICLVDSPLSSVTLGRTVATVAELAFALQWALILRAYGSALDVGVTAAVARVLVPLIVFAELSSWYATLSTNFLGNAIEQSTWTLCAVLIAVGLWSLLRHEQARARLFARAASSVMVAFVTFMLTVDVPMYFSRWRAQRESGTVFPSLAEGLHDATFGWVVAHTLEPWRDELAWMALYFSVGVLISIALSLAPGDTATAGGPGRRA